MKRLLSVPLILLTALLFAPLLNSAGVSSYSRGVALLLLGEREQAKPFLEQGLKGANLRGLIPAYQALAEGREMDAASLFERAVRQRIKGMEALIGYGQAMGEYSLYYREYYFRFAGELFPKSGAAQLCQGAFLVQQGDPAKGILFVQKALKLERVPEYRLFLALAYRYLNQEAKEREELVGALKEGALSFSALQRAAELFEREGKNQQAVALVREQGERFSSRPLYRVLLAGVLRRGGDYRGALEELGRVTGPSLQEFPFLKEKALALLEKRDRVEALKFFRQAEAMGEEDREFSLRYGEAPKSNAPRPDVGSSGCPSRRSKGRASGVHPSGRRTALKEAASSSFRWKGRGGGTIPSFCLGRKATPRAASTLWMHERQILQSHPWTKGFRAFFS